MNNLSLEDFYFKNKKSLNIASDYLGNENFPLIAKGCRLKPIELINTYSYFNKSQLYRNWIDEYQFELQLISDQDIKIRSDVLNIKKMSTDLYGGLTLSSLSKISKLALIINHQDLNLGNFQLITFYGLDNYFRTFLINGEEIKKVSTLILGWETLNQLAQKINIGSFELIKVNKTLFPDLKEKGYLTFWPPREEFWNQLNNLELKKLIFKEL